MIFRALAVLTFAFGLLVAGLALSLLGASPTSAPEARHLRDMKNRTTVPATYTPWTLADFQALPHGATLERRARREAQAVSFEGWNQRMMMAGDGDAHLELVATPLTSGGRDTVYVTGEVTPAFRRSGAWRYDRLLELFRPNRGGQSPWDSGPARVRVSGWLLYDYQYDHAPTSWSLAHSAPRATGWEIHPVTRIERWDEGRAAWVEVPR
ncbi:MAG: hypothetical protein U0704_02265 [Candidatus Eisenbacteria bacterium]